MRLYGEESRPQALSKRNQEALAHHMTLTKVENSSSLNLVALSCTLEQELKVNKFQVAELDRKRPLYKKKRKRML
jgi:hypothetical protein